VVLYDELFDDEELRQRNLTDHGIELHAMLATKLELEGRKRNGLCINMHSYVEEEALAIRC